MLVNKGPHFFKKIRQIVAWGLYDFGKSAYYSVIFTFVFASYFTSKIAPNPIIGTQLWTYTISASALLIAIVSPLLGAIADYGGHHKQWLGVFTYVSIIATALLWFAYPNEHSIPLVVVCIFISNFSLEVGSVFYNAFLPKLAPRRYLGRISGWGWACGYFGGLLCLIIALFVLIQGCIGESMANHELANIRAVALLVALWMLIFSMPIFVTLKQHDTKGLSVTKAFKKSSRELMRTLRNLPSQRSLMLFLIAYVIYIDGLNTLFALGGIYAAGTFGMRISEVLILGIILNITAGIGAIVFAWCDDKVGSKKTILITLFCLLLTLLGLLGVRSVSLFWIFAPTVGVFVGPIQAASRTLLSRLAKPEEITRMYGLYNLSGKATSFLGPLIVGSLTAFTGSQRIGMTVIIPFFIVGGVILYFVNEDST